jgi:hypothetical protein
MGKFILLTVLAYFIFRSLDRFFRPTPQNRSTSDSNRQSSKTNTDNLSKPHTKSVMKDNVGEYVDFEEIDDDTDKQK